MLYFLLYLRAENKVKLQILLIAYKFYQLLKLWKIHESLQEWIKALNIEYRTLNYSLALIVNQQLIQSLQIVTYLSLRLLYFCQIGNLRVRNLGTEHSRCTISCTFCIKRSWHVNAHLTLGNAHFNVDEALLIRIKLFYLFL